MTVAEIFEAMPTYFNPSAAGGMNKTIQWNVTGDEATKWAYKIANGTCESVPGGVDKPDVTFNITDKDWLSMAEGKLDPMSAFMSGKLKVTGDMMLAMKIPQIFPVKR